MQRRVTLVLGVLVMIAGASIVVDLLFDVGTPVLKASLAVLLLLLGARVLVQASGAVTRGPAVHHHTTAGEQTYCLSGPLTEDPEYDVVLGSATVDLTRVSPPERDVTVTVEALLGSAVVKIDPSMPYDVEGRAAFGAVRMPDHARTLFGTLTYRPPDLHEAPRLHLKINTTLGSCEVIETRAH